MYYYYYLSRQDQCYAVYENRPPATLSFHRPSRVATLPPHTHTHTYPHTPHSLFQGRWWQQDKCGTIAKMVLFINRHSLQPEASMTNLATQASLAKLPEQ